MFRAASLAAAGFVLLASLSGCGDSDDDKAAAAVSAGLLKEQDGTFQFTQKQADCVGDGFVEEIGVDQLKEYGIITEDLEASDKPIEAKLTGDDAAGAGKVLVDCVDAAQLFKDAMLTGAGPEPRGRVVHRRRPDRRGADRLLHAPRSPRTRPRPARRWLRSRSASPAEPGTRRQAIPQSARTAAQKSSLVPVEPNTSVLESSSPVTASKTISKRTWPEFLAISLPESP